MRTSGRPQPFHDLRVVEVGSTVAGAWAGRVLSDFGCDVVKVEGLQGDASRRYGPFPPGHEGDLEMSGLFHYLNLNKRGVSVDLDRPEDGRALRALLVEADVCIVDLPLRDQERWRLTFADDLRDVNPRLIVVSLTPFGMSGPNRYRRAYDLNIAAASGIAVGLGRAGEAPLNLPLFQVLFQGGLAAAAASLVALIARDDGRVGGQQVEIAIEEVIATQHAGRALPTFIYQGVTGKRAGAEANYFGRYPSGNRWCKDGQVTLSAPQLDQWLRFVKVLGTPAWTENPRYRDRRAMQVEYREEVDALVQPWLDARTRSDILDVSLEHRIPFAPVFKGSELREIDHFVDRGTFIDVSRDGVGWFAPRPAYLMSEWPFECRRPAPRLGEHNAELLAGHPSVQRGGAQNGG